MKTKKLLLAMALTGGMAANANAAIVLNDWMLDVTGIDGIGAANGVTSPISFMGFDNTFHTVIDFGANGILNAGDTFNVQANGIITDMFDASSGTITPDLFGSTSTLGGVTGWELTFTFNINGVFTTDPSGANLNTNFDHLNGSLVFYADRISTSTGENGEKAATAAANPHVTDGVKIAEFAVINDALNDAFGGVFSAALGNGGDKAQFVLIDNPLNAFKDKDGNPLVAGGPDATLAFTNSDFQSNVAGSGPFGYDPAAYNCGKTLADFCGTESGQFRVAQVPEPASLALISLGLLSLGMTIRRRQSL